MSYPCRWCANKSRTFAEAKAHALCCPAFSARLAALGFDLEVKVRNGLALEAAEAEQARRPSLRL